MLQLKRWKGDVVLAVRRNAKLGQPALDQDSPISSSVHPQYTQCNSKRLEKEWQVSLNSGSLTKRSTRMCADVRGSRSGYMLHACSARKKAAMEDEAGSIGGLDRVVASLNRG